MKAAADHRELAAHLAGRRAAVVISGYPSTLYDQLYDGWHTRTLRAYTGQAHHAGSSGRTEAVWSNRPFADGAALFDLA